MVGLGAEQSTAVGGNAIDKIQMLVEVPRGALF
jgi:hypothetical protein